MKTTAKAPVINSLRDVPVGTFWETPLLHAKVYADEIHLFLQENVQVPGKIVVANQFTLEINGEQLPVGKLLDVIERHAPGLTSDALVAYLRAIARRNPNAPHFDVLIGTDGQRVFRTEVPGIRVYTRTGMRRLKPLTSRPEKLTLAHVKRALANGQFRNLRCVHDVHDLGPGIPDELGPLDANRFLSRLVTAEGNSGWYAGYIGAGSNQVVVAQHHFNRNTFELAL